MPSNSTLSLLKQYFTTVKNLRVYLSEILDVDSGDLVRDWAVSGSRDEPDWETYLNLINTSYVAFNTPDAQERNVKFKIFPPMIYKAEIKSHIVKIIKMTLMNPFFR